MKNKTTKTELQKLQDAAAEGQLAILKFREYRRTYNEEHNISGKTTIIKEIIALAKKGMKNAEIIAKGYNKNTVNRQVGLWKKGKKVEKTIVSQWLKKEKKGKKKNEESEEEEEDDNEGEI